MNESRISKKDLNLLAIPLGSLVCIILLFFVAGRMLLNRINDLRSQVSLVRAEEQLLFAKLSTLQEFQLQGVNWSESASLAIPRSSPIIGAISQIRLVASAFGLQPFSIVVGSTIDDGVLSYADINFELDGDLGSILNFMDDLKQTAPFGKIQNMEINKTVSGVAADIVYRAYYSDLPLTIPSILEPLTEFTLEDQEIINTFLGLSPPRADSVTPFGPIDNPNPFGI